MTIKLVFRRLSIVLVALLLCVGCANNRVKPTAEDNVIIDDGYLEGAITGAAIGALIINKRNEIELQKALKKDEPTVFIDQSSDKKIKIAPRERYQNKNNLPCVEFEIINLDTKKSSKGNTACLVGEVYKFDITENKITEPVIKHYSPYPVPRPEPPPSSQGKS